ncbi:MAG: phosphatase PAP2 family protein [Bacteroidales bacterium]
MKSPYRFNLILIAVFLLGLFLVILTGINKPLFIAINSFGQHFYSFIWENLTFLGDTLTACAIMILFIRKRPDLIWAGILATLLATLIVNIIKSNFDIPRPLVIIDKNLISVIGPSLYRHSFPSGHTVTIFALAGMLVFYFRNFFSRICIIVLALLVGISRIAVGVHWPADVLAGAALGISCATTGVYLVEKIGWNRNKTVQLIVGFLLILSIIYLLIFYDCKYEQAIYLQAIVSLILLTTGIRECYLLFKNR